MLSVGVFYFMKDNDEAYKILDKSQHHNWFKFKHIHSEKIVNFVRYQLGEKVVPQDFIETHAKLTSAKTSQRRKIKNATHYYREFLLNRWIN